MRHHVFVVDDLYVGAKLCCIGVTEYRWATIGQIYVVDSVRPTSLYPFVITDDTEHTSWALWELNLQPPIVEYYPLDRLTAKERFLFELSGRLPE